jgi:hypothetical protein
MRWTKKVKVLEAPVVFELPSSQRQVKRKSQLCDLCASAVNNSGGPDRLKRGLLVGVCLCVACRGEARPSEDGSVADNITCRARSAGTLVFKRGDSFRGPCDDATVGWIETVRKSGSLRSGPTCRRRTALTPDASRSKSNKTRQPNIQGVGP